MKNTKRIIATVLTAVMMISMLPSSVFAAELDAYDVVEPAVEAVSVPAEEQEIESTVEDISVEDAEEVQGSSEEIETVDAADPEAADVIEDTEAPVVGAENFPAQDFEGKTDSVTVKVHAPEGALPAGTELKVEEVKKEDVENLVSEGTEDFVAVDISFHVDGKEEDFEPLAAVEVEFVLEKDVLPQTENYDVIHVAVDEKGEEIPEVIEEKNIIDEFTTEGGKISQKDFSVFIIAAAGTSSSADTDDEKAVATYKFVVNGEEQADYEQYVKSGEYLVEPPAPVVGADQVFEGWFEGESETPFDFSSPIATVTSRTEHTLTAKIENAVYVTFYDYDNTTVVETKKVAAGAEVDTTDVEAQSQDTDHVFAGWALSAGSSEKIADSITVNSNTSLYAVYTSGYKLSFDLNDDDGAGSKATFVAPQYLTATGIPTRPENPTRDGFTFDDWYTTADGTTKFDFTSPISADTTAYAKWIGADSHYVVVVWQQKVTDDKNATEKTYDFKESSEPISAITGSEVNAPDSYLLKNYEGFKFAKADTNVVVKADGSTIVNVYYDRLLIKYTFNGGIYRYPEAGEVAEYYRYNDRWPTGYYFGGTGPEAGDHTILQTSCPYIWTLLQGWHRALTGRGLFYRYENKSGYYHEGEDPDPNASPMYVYVESGEMTGLYGQPFEMYGYTWPMGQWIYTNNGGGSTTLVYIGEFKILDATDPLNVQFNTSTSQPTYTIYYYLADEDGEYTSLSNIGHGYGSASSRVRFTVIDKYDGYEPDKYILGAYTPGGEGEGSSVQPSEERPIPSNGVIEFTPSRDGTDLHIFYKRKSYDVEFKYTDGTTAHETVTRVLGADLSDLSDIEAPEYRGSGDAENYNFTGWYSDQSCINLIDFNGMTVQAHNLVAYAGFELAKHTIKIDPNGGTFADGTTEVKTVDVTHESAVPAELLDDASITRREYEFTGWTLETEEGVAWHADDVVTAEITLVANWRTTKALTLKYVGNDGLIGSSPETYRHNAFAKITEKASDYDQDGKTMHFKAWSENQDGTGTLYYPGQLFKMDAAKADKDSGYIFLYAVYSEFELETTDIKFYVNLDAEGAKVAYDGEESDDFVEWKEIRVNKEIDLSNVTVTAPAGYTFLGWAKSADATAKIFDADAKVAADETGNALYAVWEEQKFTVYHSGIREYTDYSIAKDCVKGKFNIVGATDSDYLYGGYYKYSESEGVAQKGTAYTESGLSMTPAAGTTYYLKEVDKRYLIPSVYRIYRTASPQVLRDMYLMTAVDNETTKVGFTIGGKDQSAAGKAKTITINKKGGRDATVIDSENKTICGIKDQMVAYLNLKDYVDDSNYEKNWNWDDQIVVTAFYVTEDKVKVTGAKNNTFTFGAEEALNQKWLTKTSMTSSKADVDPVYTDATALTLKASSARHTYMINASKALELAVTKVDNGKKIVQNVNEGNNTGKITYSGKANYVFAGWYEDASYTKAADFSNVTKDMTVYAKYVKASDVKLSFAKKSVKGGKVTLKATLKINNQPNVTDAAVECSYNDKAYDVTFTGVKATKSGSATVNTFSGAVTIDGLANNDTFKAAISYTTPDGTLVSMESKTCKYNAGLVTVK